MKTKKEAVHSLLRLSKKSAGRKRAFSEKGVVKNVVKEEERFFETPAFAVFVNRPLAYSRYADGGRFPCSCGF